MRSRISSRFVSLLRATERFTKTDMVYLAKGGFWLTSEQIFLGALALVVSMAFARYVSPETYGTYRFLVSLFWTLSAFSLTGIATALSRAVARGEEGAYREAIPFSLLGALPMSVIAGGISFYYFAAGNTTLGYGSLAIALLAPFFQAGYLYGAFLEGRKEFRRAALYSLALNLVPALSLLALMPFGMSPLAFFITYLASNVTIALILSAVVFTINRPNEIRSPELKNLGWHMSAINILGTIANQLDQLLVFHYLGAAELAIYAFATALPDQLKSMATNLANIAFPKFVQRPIKEIQAMMGYRIMTVTLVFLVGIIAYVIIAPLFFNLFFPAYGASIFYSQIYAFSLITMGSMIPATVLQAHAAKRELYLFNIGSSLVQIATLFIGILWYGLLGLIIARAASRLFNLAYSTYLVRRYAARSV